MRIIIPLVLFLFFSCSNNPTIEREYYEGTDIVKMERIYHSNNKSNYKAISYYKNGQVKMRGSFKNDKEEGLWEHWFADGVKKNSVHFIEGRADYDYRRRESPKLIFDQDSLRIGVPIRIKAVGLCFMELTISGNVDVELDEKDGYFNYKILPLEGDSVSFYYERLELVDSDISCKKYLSKNIDVSEEELQNSAIYKTSLEKIVTVPIYK